jgi:hypothetical protein
VRKKEGEKRERGKGRKERKRCINLGLLWKSLGLLGDWYCWVGRVIGLSGLLE